MRGALVLCLVLASGCAATKNEAPDAGGGGANGAAGTGGHAGARPVPQIPETGYSMWPGDTGGYLLDGTEIPASEVQETKPLDNSTGCKRLRGIVRDFRGALPAVGGDLQPGGHPDFEVFQGETPTTGLLAPLLKLPERKPIYASVCELGTAPSPTLCPYGAMTTSAENFQQWYTSREGVNKTYYVYFELAGPDLGTSRFSSNHFFPVDGTGWGNSGVDENDKTKLRNYSFTTEIHTTFPYNGHETFTFTGDDDVWIFINGKLAVDLGGLHAPAVGVVDLDAAAAKLGIQKGSVYPLDLFHAERHSVKSDFGFDMNFEFQDCGYIIP